MTNNWFVGRKFKGIIELKRNLEDKVYKTRDMKVDNVTSEIAKRTNNIDIIEFDDSNSIYIGCFVTSNKESLKLLQASKDFKKTVELIQRDFTRIPMKYEDIIIEKSQEMS